MAIGGGKNAIETFRDARRTNMSRAASIAWAIANAGAVIAGGFAGRAVANMGIDMFNRAHPENRVFQNEEHRTINTERAVTRDVEYTRMEYTDEALRNSERIAKMWYRDNPDLLQQRVDTINTYNAEHGTNIDPYRAIMINGDAGGQTFDNMRLHVNNSHIDPNVNDVYSGGNHRVLTNAWGRANGFSADELNAARNLFNADGTINSRGFDVIGRMDGLISDNNSVGYVSGRPVQTDGYFRPNDPAGWTTYTGGNPAMTEHTYVTTETVMEPTTETITEYTRANGDGMAAFGNYNPRERKTTLRERLGIPYGWRRRHETEPTPEIIPAPEFDDINGPMPNDGDKNFETPDLSQGSENRPENPFDFVPVNPIVDDENHKNPDDDIFVAPIDEHKSVDDTLVLPGAHGPRLLPAGNWVKDAPEPVFAVHYSDAKAYNDLTKNIVREQSKSHPNQKKLTRLKQEQMELYNELGRPDMLEFDRARVAAYNRHAVAQKMAELERLSANRPDTSRGATRFDIKDWNRAKSVLEREIAELGGAGILDTSHLRFAEPIKSDSRKHKEERWARLDAEKAERDAVAAERVSKPRAKDTERIENTEMPGVKLSDLRNPFEFNTGIPHTERMYRRDALTDLSNHTVPRVDVAEMSRPRTPIMETPDATVPVDESVKPLPNPFDLVNTPTVETPVTTAPVDKPEKPLPNPFDLTNTPNPISTKEQSAEQPKARNGFWGRVLDRASDLIKKTGVGRKYFVPESLKTLAKTPNLFQEEIMKIRDVPVRIVNLDGHGAYLTQNNDRPIVVVEVDGKRFLYALITGYEQYSSQNTGHWEPVYAFTDDGYLCDSDVASAGQDAWDIAAALDDKIGDIRNYSDEYLTRIRNEAGLDGFVGGADAVSAIDFEHIVQRIHNEEQGDSRIWGKYQNMYKVGINDVNRFFNKLGTNEWWRKNTGLRGWLSDKFGRK